MPADNMISYKGVSLPTEFFMPKPTQSGHASPVSRFDPTAFDSPWVASSNPPSAAPTPKKLLISHRAISSKLNQQDLYMLLVWLQKLGFKLLLWAAPNKGTAVPIVTTLSLEALDALIPFSAEHDVSSTGYGS